MVISQPNHNSINFAVAIMQITDKKSVMSGPDPPPYVFGLGTVPPCALLHHLGSENMVAFQTSASMVGHATVEVRH